METNRLDRVRVDVEGNVVEINWAERDELLFKLRFVAGCETIVEKFEAVGASRPAELDDDERSRLRVALEVWARDVVPSDGIGRLLAALQAEPGSSSG
jgi:hypothetical protein